MTAWGISQRRGQGSRWPRRFQALGAFLAPPLLCCVALTVAPSGPWLRSLDAKPFQGHDVSELKRQGYFSLDDASGQRRTLAGFAGMVTLVTFGYTHCPDACPTTLARLAKARALLGADAARLKVIFITVDPQRDDVQLLQNYVAAFDPSFIALRGDDDQTDSAARAFGADYRILESGDREFVEHTVDTYLVDPAGNIRVVLPYDMTAEAVAQDVHAVMGESGLCWPGSANRQALQSG